MKQRSLGKMFLLFVVTFGIYRLYWIYKTRKEMVKLGQKIPSFWLLVVGVILFSVLAIAGLAATIMTDPDTYNCSTIADSARAQCQADYEPGGLFYVGIGAFYAAILAIGPAIAAWFWPYCKAVENVTREKLSFPLAMISMILIPDGFDMLVIQDGFNKLSKKGK